MALTVEEIKQLSDWRLFVKIAEEASEVIKAIMKMAAHGVRPVWEGVKYDNGADTIEEFRQLDMLMTEFRLRYHYDTFA